MVVIPQLCGGSVFVPLCCGGRSYLSNMGTYLSKRAT